MTIERPDIEAILMFMQGQIGLDERGWTPFETTQSDMYKNFQHDLEHGEPSKCWRMDDAHTQQLEWDIATLCKAYAALESENARLKAELAERDARIGELENFKREHFRDIANGRD